MKIANSIELWPVPDETIARLGRVLLVRKSDGSHELTGGTANERDIAREWCARFATFIEFDEPTMQELWLLTVLKLQLQKFGFGRKCGRDEFLATAKLMPFGGVA